ncbi:uncharacterized protein LOC144651161 [Oculina patagonica]
MAMKSSVCVLAFIVILGCLAAATANEADDVKIESIRIALDSMFSPDSFQSRLIRHSDGDDGKNLKQCVRWRKRRRIMFRAMCKFVKCLSEYFCANECDKALKKKKNNKNKNKNNNRG